MDIIFDVTPENATADTPLLTLSAQNLFEALESPEGINLSTEVSLAKLVRIAKETYDLAFSFRLCTDIVLNIRPETLENMSPISVHALYECLNLFHRFDGVYGFLENRDEDNTEYLAFLESKYVDTHIKSRLVIDDDNISTWHAISSEAILKTFLAPFFKTSLLSSKKHWAGKEDTDKRARELKDFYIRLRDSIVDDFMYGLKSLPSFQLFTEKYGMPDEWEKAFYMQIYPSLSAAAKVDASKTGN